PDRVRLVQDRNMDLRAASAQGPSSSPWGASRAERRIAPPLLFSALAFCASLLVGSPATATAILPAPAVEAPGQGVFHLTAKTVIAAPAGDAAALAAARY